MRKMAQRCAQIAQLRRRKKRRKRGPAIIKMMMQMNIFSPLKMFKYRLSPCPLQCTPTTYDSIDLPTYSCRPPALLMRTSIYLPHISTKGDRPSNHMAMWLLVCYSIVILTWNNCNIFLIFQILKNIYNLIFIIWGYNWSTFLMHFLYINFVIVWNLLWNRSKI